MDWSRVIHEIQDAGLTQTAIAQRVGCDQSHISDLKTGAQREPRASIGFALVELRDELLAHGKSKKRPSDRRAVA